jgi:hypothetical protein
MRAYLYNFVLAVTAFVMIGLQSTAIAGSWDLVSGWATDDRKSEDTRNL